MMLLIFLWLIVSKGGGLFLHKKENCYRNNLMVTLTLWWEKPHPLYKIDFNYSIPRLILVFMLVFSFC